MPNYEAPCGACAGGIVSADQLGTPRNRCPAITLIPATGIHYQHETGREEGQRTHEVYSVNQTQCEAIFNRDECPEITGVPVTGE